MKQATCKDLNGPCDVIITGDTPEEIGNNCRDHVMDMVNDGDQLHKDAIAAWMQKPKQEQEAFYKDFTANFDSLADV